MSETAYELTHHGRSIVFDCPNAICLDRARTVLTKEPGTITWIDGFAPGEVFWDVGANVGVDSLSAAVMRDVTVLAFEPSAANYHVLNRNIVANGLDRQVRALCVALDRTLRLADLNMRSEEAGSARHTFGEAVDFRGRFDPAFLQASLGVSIDSLCSQFGAPAPDHLKIDVDGNEPAVVAGAANVLRTCRSVLVEMDLNDAAEVREIASAFQAAGLVQDENVVGNQVREHKGVRIYNMIFRRPEPGLTQI